MLDNIRLFCHKFRSCELSNSIHSSVAIFTIHAIIQHCAQDIRNPE